MTSQFSRDQESYNPAHEPSPGTTSHYAALTGQASSTALNFLHSMEEAMDNFEMQLSGTGDQLIPGLSSPPRTRSPVAGPPRDLLQMSPEKPGLPSPTLTQQYDPTLYHRPPGSQTPRPQSAPAVSGDQIPSRGAYRIPRREEYDFYPMEIDVQLPRSQDRVFDPRTTRSPPPAVTQGQAPSHTREPFRLPTREELDNRLQADIQLLRSKVTPRTTRSPPVRSPSPPLTASPPGYDGDLSDELIPPELLESASQDEFIWAGSQPTRNQPPTSQLQPHLTNTVPEYLPGQRQWTDKSDRKIMGMTQQEAEEMGDGHVMARWAQHHIPPSPTRGPIEVVETAPRPQLTSALRSGPRTQIKHVKIHQKVTKVLLPHMAAERFVLPEGEARVWQEDVHDRHQKKPIPSIEEREEEQRRIAAQRPAIPTQTQAARPPQPSPPPRGATRRAASARPQRERTPSPIYRRAASAGSAGRTPPVPASHRGQPHHTPAGTPSAGASGIPRGGSSGIQRGGHGGIPRGGPSGIPRGTPSGIPRGSPSGSHIGGSSGIPRGSPSGIPRGSPSGSPSGIPTASHSGIPTASHSGIQRGGHSGIQRGGHTGIPTVGHSGIQRGGHTGIPPAGHSGIQRGGHTGIPTAGHSGIQRGGHSGIPRGGPSGIPRGGHSAIPRGSPSGIPRIGQGPSRGPDPTRSMPVFGGLEHEGYVQKIRPELTQGPAPRVIADPSTMGHLPDPNVLMHQKTTKIFIPQPDGDISQQAASATRAIMPAMTEDVPVPQFYEGSPGRSSTPPPSPTSPVAEISQGFARLRNKLDRLQVLAERKAREEESLLSSSSPH